MKFCEYFKKAFIAILLLVSPLVFAGEYGERFGVNLIEGVTAVSEEIFGLHMTVFWICVVIAIIVYGGIFYMIVAHKKTPGKEPATFSHNTTLEWVWTVIPVLVLVSISIPAINSLQKIYEGDRAPSDIEILVTGYQWKWKYQYLDHDGNPDNDISFFSILTTDKDEIYNKKAKGEHYLLEVDNQVVIPVGKKVKFLVTAADVIHSWWVPDFAMKRDAIPGYVNSIWVIAEEEGVYRGQCAELCGKDHGFMPIVVRVVSEEEYGEWVSSQRQEKEELLALESAEFGLDELMAMGKKVYDRNCASCHMGDGSGIGGVFPALKGNAIVLEDMDKHIEIVIKGVKGTGMPAFGGQLSDVDLSAVITYERNAWGNDTGDVLQPSEVTEWKKGQ